MTRGNISEDKQQCYRQDNIEASSEAHHFSIHVDTPSSPQDFLTFNIKGIFLVFIEDVKNLDVGFVKGEMGGSGELGLSKVELELG